MAPSTVVTGWKRFRLGGLETTEGVRVCSEARCLLDNPPDGVDLAALCPDGGNMVSPEQCRAMYEKAFVDAGGRKALEASKAIMETLQIRMKEAASDHCGWNRSLHAHQLQVWQSYGLDFMMKRIGKGSAVRLHGEKLLLELANDLKKHVNSRVELLIAEPKHWARSSIKIRIKYASDCSQLGDLNRASFVCPDIQTMYAVADFLFDQWGPTVWRQQPRIVEFEDHYQKPMPGGYRHLQVLVCISGSLWEVQLNTETMQGAKKIAGHKLYATTRFVKEMVLLASMEGDIGVLQELLAQPGVREVADPNAVKDKNGLSALHHAAFRGDLDVLALLLNKDCLSNSADPWALDDAKCGGLPLNYAMQMHHYSVASILVKHMVDQTPSLDTAAPVTKARLAEAIAAVVDAHETEAIASETDAAPRRAAEELLRSLVRLWNNICGRDTFKGVDPFCYAFSRKATFSINIFFEFVDLWLVDGQGMLPIERAITLGIVSAAETMSTRMLTSLPNRLPPEATWSLARCRGKGRLPEQLVGEFIVSELILRRMADDRNIVLGSSHTIENDVHRAHDRTSPKIQVKHMADDRHRVEVKSHNVENAARRAHDSSTSPKIQDPEDAPNGWGVQSKSIHRFRKLDSTQRRGENLIYGDPIVDQKKLVLQSPFKVALPPVHPPHRQQRPRTNHGSRAELLFGDQPTRMAR